MKRFIAVSILVWAAALGASAAMHSTRAASTVTVSVACDTTGTYKGIYTGVSGGVPIVTVAVDLPYGSLFKSFGLGGSLHLRAESKVAVMGV